ncbi:MAG: TonB-dependent siderophore receptor [Siculibacillus sp.]|nr:TonB-dependent siderophore receptor [Siculibacillus sp.]
MSTESLSPASLRARLGVSRVAARADIAVPVAVATMVALGGTAAAQSVPATLPALTVEAQKEQKKPARPKKAATRAAPASAAEAKPTEAQEAAAAAARVPGTGGVNPNAEPGAPYKINSSASSKLVKPLAEQPRTIVAIPKEVMEDKAATSFRELVRTTAGITLGSGEGGNPFGDRVFIRGFDARNDVFVDGQRDSGIAVRENFASEQVEVLKGPASTVAGRGTAGGAVNIETKKPFFADHHEATTTVGTDATRRVEIDVNKKISETFAIRANGMWQKAEVAGRDQGRDDRWGGLIAATWRPSESFKTTIDWYHLDIDQLPDYGVPMYDNRPMTEYGLPRGTYFGLASRDHLHYEQDIVTAKTEIALGDAAKWTNRVRIGRSDYDMLLAKPGGASFDALTGLYSGRSSTTAHVRANLSVAMTNDVEFRVSTFGIEHTFVAGFEVMREDMRVGSKACTIGSTGATTTCTPADGVTYWSYADIFNFDFSNLTPASTYVASPMVTDVGIDTKSLHLLDSIDLTDRLKLDLGARIDDFSVERTGGISRHDTLLNWNAALTWKFWRDANVYAAYGTSANPIGAELDVTNAAYGGIDAATSALAPELNKSWEIGTKWQLFDRKLLASAALFRTEKENARERVGAGGAAIWSDKGAYRVQGVELNVAGNVADRWSVFGGAVFMDSEVTRSPTAANVGKRLGRNAHETFNLLTKYRLTDDLTIGGGATYKSRVHGGTLAEAAWSVPGGWRFDVMAEWKLRKNVTLRANVNNIFDTVLYETPYENAAQYAHIQPGRVGYVSLNVKY